MSSHPHYSDPQTERENNREVKDSQQKSNGEEERYKLQTAVFMYHFIQSPAMLKQSELIMIQELYISKLR